MEADANLVNEALALTLAHERVATKLLRSVRRFRSRRGSGYALELIALGLLAKATCAVQGVSALIDLSLSGEAQVLLRTLVELTVKLGYIFKYPDRCAQLYLDFQHIAKWREFQRAHRAPGAVAKVLDQWPKAEEDLRREYEAHKGPYLTRKGQVRRNWHTETLSEMAEEVGAADVWETMYPVDSGLVHSGPDALHQYCRQTPDGALHMMPTPPAYRSMRILCDTMHCLASVTQLAARLFHSTEVLAALEELAERRAQLCPAASPQSGPGGRHHLA